MLTVAASVIIEDAYRMIGWDPDQLETRQEQQARQALSMALQEVYEAWWWEELMTSAQFNGATVYSASPLPTVDTFYYYPATQRYYQSLSNINAPQPPATLGSDGVTYCTNYGNWALAQGNLVACDYSATAVYALGAQVRGPADGLVYQLYQYGPNTVTMTVAGAGLAAANGLYTYAGIGSGVAYYTSANGYTMVLLSGDWVIYGPGSFIVYASTQYTANSPDQVTTWFSTNGSLTPNPVNNPTPSVTVNLTVQPAPPNAAVWHALIPFTPEVSVPGQVRAVGRTDPRNSAGVGLQAFELAPDANYRLPGWCWGVPWVWYRQQTPILTGDAYDAGVGYSDANGDTTGFIATESGVGILTEH